MPLIIPRVLFYADSRNEDGPKRNELYVMIEDGSVRSFHDLTRKLDWDIVEKDTGFFYHTTQDQELKSCFVRYSGWADEEAMKGIRALGILQEK
jgi:capsule polysaccharide export protein KpsC/LpsZ